MGRPAHPWLLRGRGRAAALVHLALGAPPGPAARPKPLPPALVHGGEPRASDLYLGMLRMARAQAVVLRRHLGLVSAWRGLRPAPRRHHLLCALAAGRPPR